MGCNKCNKLLHTDIIDKYTHMGAMDSWKPLYMYTLELHDLEMTTFDHDLDLTLWRCHYKVTYIQCDEDLFYIWWGQMMMLLQWRTVLQNNLSSVDKNREGKRWSKVGKKSLEHSKNLELSRRNLHCTRHPKKWVNVCSNKYTFFLYLDL